MKLIRILVFLLILNSFILTGFLSQYTGKVVVNTKIEYANLTRIIDGDTIDTSLGKVRLLGINTPEKNQKGYQEAKDFLQQFEGKEISLELTKEDIDKYNRKLRYLFYKDNFINKKILEYGFAHFYTYNEDKYTDELRKTEEKAREKEIGIWEKSKEECAACIILIKLSEVDPGEYIILGNKCKINCSLIGWTIDDDSYSHTRKLNNYIEAEQSARIDYNGSIWNDDGDSLYLRDERGFLALFYRY